MTTPYDATAKQKSQAKTSRIPIKIVPAETLKKPDWIRVKAGSSSTRFYEIKQILREHKLHTVCEEASCPNIGECFGKGTATFMIMGDKCTRRRPFCDVGHGRPDPLDAEEPLNLARTIAALKLLYVVITSVDRDDLRDGGAGHFVACIEKVRELSPATRIEILTPDFRGRMDRALEILKAAPPDVMNHNLETAPRLYKEARPGSDYAYSLNLAKTIAALRLKYVVITSVDRDDLRDGGAGHFVDCIRQVRTASPQTRIEILVPDFRGRDERALEILAAAPPDVMNHNLETAPRLYKQARPGSDYGFSLNLLRKFKARHPGIPTKSGLMVGLGETDEEILAVMRDLRDHGVDMLTVGQYLAPSGHHLPVRRYVHPDTFRMFEAQAREMGFSHAAVGAMVRSSYHADQQAAHAGIGSQA